MFNPKELLIKARRIAVARTDRLGDMVLTLPLCAALKEYCPNATIVLIARSYTEPLLINCPAIDKVYYIDKLKAGFKGVFGLDKFDAIFFPHPRLNEALTGFSQRVPLRVGSGFRYYSILFNHRVYDHRKTAEYHEAEYNVRMLESITDEQVRTQLVKPFIAPEWERRLDEILIENGYKHGSKIVVIHPATSGSTNEWSPENFGRAASVLSKIEGVQTVITGTAAESWKCRNTASLSKTSINLCGGLSLELMIALLGKCSLLLSNATGILHIAAALGKSVVGLYPNSPHISPRRWGPYSIYSTALAPQPEMKGGYNDNMEDILIEDVLRACTEYLN